VCQEGVAGNAELDGVEGRHHHWEEQQGWMPSQEAKSVHSVAHGTLDLSHHVPGRLRQSIPQGP
jgi:hypothetical protein